MTKEIRMPAGGQTTDVSVVGTWLVKCGDKVKRGDALLEVETDKATLTVESYAKGIVLALLAEEGDRVPAGEVIALIGERGREVREFVERDLGEEGMRRSVVVVATSDKSALERNKAAKTACAIAEYFRDQGKDVLLMMDSLTRFSMAQREIGLASGEPPVSRGYPPSVYSEMPRLLERAGCAATGSITGLYTVLVDGDDMNEPITDTARSILDGHIMLNRRLAHQNHYPAIDVLQSISRCMSQIVNKEHKTLAGKLKNVLATYNEAEDLINIGAYKSGSNRNIDYAIAKIEAVNDFLMQDVDSKYDYEEAVDMLRELFAEAEDADAE